MPCAPHDARWQREAFVLGPLVLLAIGTGEYVARQQAGQLSMLLATAAFIGTQMVPGVLTWRRFRPDDGWLVEDLAMGAALGLAMGAVAQVVGLALGLTGISFVVPWLLALVALAPRQARRRALAAGFDDLPRGWGGAVAVVGLGSVIGAVKLFPVLPVDWTGWAVVYDDSPFHAALAGELTHGWPPHYPQVAGEVLHYHWFSHAWVAQMGGVSGVDLVVLQDRFLAALTAVLVPVLIACVAMRIARAPWAGPLAACFAVFVGPVDLWHVSVTPMPTNPLSPSVGFAAALMLAALLVLVMRWRRELPPGSYALLVGLVVVAGGAKGTVLPIVLAGVAAAGIAVLVSRRARELVDVRVMALDALTCLVVFALELKLVFGGGDGGLEITPLTGLAHRYVVDYGRVFTDLGVGAIVLITVVVLAAQLLTMLSFVGVLRDPTSGRDPVLWALLGGTAAGLAATLLLNRLGGSQSYFRVSGWLLLSIACGWGLWLLIPHLKGLARAQWVGLAGLFVGAVALEQLLGPTYRSPAGLWLAPLLLVVATALVLLVAAPSRRHPSAGPGRGGRGLPRVGPGCLADAVRVHPGPPSRRPARQRAACDPGRDPLRRGGRCEVAAGPLRGGRRRDDQPALPGAGGARLQAHAVHRGRLVRARRPRRGVGLHLEDERALGRQPRQHERPVLGPRSPAAQRQVLRASHCVGRAEAAGTRRPLGLRLPGASAHQALEVRDARASQPDRRCLPSAAT